MDTNEVVEMIDAITEGRPFETQIPTYEETSQLMISCDETGFMFQVLTELGPIGALLNDPRTAREIAGALVAWANRKEGAPLKSAVDLVKSDSRAVNLQAEVTGPNTADAIKLMSGRMSKADWYRRNVGGMTQETKQRDFEDLGEILLATPNTPENKDTLIDLQRSMQILRENGAKDFPEKGSNV